MNRQPIYDSRDTRYKTPYGAVPAGTAVQFTLRPPRDAGISRARLVATFEFRDNQTVTLDMPWCDLELGRDLFRATLDTTDYIGLVWYSFELENFNGQVERLGTYQLTDRIKVEEGRAQVIDAANKDNKNIFITITL